MSEDNTLAGRIASRITALNLTERDVSMRATGGPDTIRNIRRGTIPAGDKLLRIAQVLETTVEWLFAAPNAAQASDDDVEIQQWDVAYGMGAGGYVDLPVTGEMQKFSRSWLRQFTQAPPERIFLASGTGDSMAPTIHDSDIVLIDTSQRDVRMADRIYAAAYGMTGIIKRLRPMPDGSVKILSDNPNVAPETAYDGELHVVGRVVAIVRKM